MRARLPGIGLAKLERLGLAVMQLDSVRHGVEFAVQDLPGRCGEDAHDDVRQILTIDLPAHAWQRLAGLIQV